MRLALLPEFVNSIAASSLFYSPAVINLDKKMKEHLMVKRSLKAKVNVK